MKHRSDGITFVEILIIIIVLAVICIFTIPKLIRFSSITAADVDAKKAANYLYSAYRMCQLDATDGNKKCSTVKDVLEYIASDNIDMKENTLIIDNITEIKFNPEDTLDNGTSFAIVLPETKEAFTLYFTSKGDVSTKKPGGKEGSGGITIKATIDPYS